VDNARRSATVENSSPTTESRTAAGNGNGKGGTGERQPASIAASKA
jgi:hypothetical protein